MRQETSRAQLRAASARALASQGTPAEGIVFKLHDQPVARGARLFERRCLACHRVGERGTAYGPVLTDYLSRDWIRGALVTPDAAEYYGKAKLGGMESQELDEASLSLLLDLLHALRELPPDAKELPPALESAGRIFESARCGQCHALWSSTHRLGPSLAGYGSAAWLNGLLRDPSAPEYFGAQNQMVLTGEKLSDSERDDLVAYLQTLETR